METENAVNKSINLNDGNEIPSVNNDRYWNLEDILELEADDKVFKEHQIEEEVRLRILGDIQAGILKATKHRYTMYCFLSFKKGKEKNIAEWLKNMPLTSSLEQESAPLKDTVTLFLSFEGYEFFCDPKKIEQFIPLGDDDIIAFKNGLAKRCPEAFGSRMYLDKKFKEPYDALILIATNDEDDLLKNSNSESDAGKRNLGLQDFFIEMVAVEKHLFDDFFEKVHFEIGLRNPEGTAGDPREWFGFRDGISNPRFFPPNKENLGYEPDKPSKLNTVLRRNHLSPQPYACGSFVVFLKLEQNVKAFSKLAKDLAQKLGMDDYPGYAAAYIMGRHKDGTPLHESFKFPTTEKRNLNEFNFREDQDIPLCPFHAHIRKVRPRDGNEEENRIVRRGKVYGTSDSKNKGVLFLSFQSSLRQFEDIVNKGVYGYNYKNKNIGKDVLFSEKREYHGSHRYRNIFGKPRTPYLRAKDKLVKFKGGQYFFASSISFIRVNLENCMP